MLDILILVIILFLKEAVLQCVLTATGYCQLSIFRSTAQSFKISDGECHLDSKSIDAVLGDDVDSLVGYLQAIEVFNIV